MARWSIHGWASGNSTSSASGVTIDGSSSALSFGGGTRASFQTNITLGSWNTAMHHAASTAESSTDICGSPHLWPIYPFTNFDTGLVLDGTYISVARNTLQALCTPHPARGIGIKFNHDFGVKVSPVTIWAGTSPGIATDPQSCLVAVIDLSTGAGTQPTWAIVTPSSAYSLKTHANTNDEASEHWWSVGLSVQPTVVGHNGENVIRFEATYY